MHRSRIKNYYIKEKALAIEGQPFYAYKKMPRYIKRYSKNKNKRYGKITDKAW
jgi:hypothetical protein